MYGTIAHMRVKPGMGNRIGEELRKYESLNIPGFVGTYVYRMDSDPNEYYLTVMFDSKESYFANARDPEQDARYRKLLDILVSEPEWHDGEVAYSFVTSGQSVRR